MPLADLDAQRFGLEAIAAAGLARHVGEIAGDLLARPFGIGLAVAALEIGDDAFERPLGFVGARAVVVGKADLGVAGAMEDRILRLFRQVLPFGVERELVMLAQGRERLRVIGRARFRPRRDGALAQRALLVGNDQLGVDMLLDAKPAAFRAGAERVVEREQPRLDLRNGETRHRTGEFLREDQAVRIGRGSGRELRLLFTLPLKGEGRRLAPGRGHCPQPDPHPNGSRSSSPFQGEVKRFGHRQRIPRPQGPRRA